MLASLPEVESLFIKPIFAGKALGKGVVVSIFGHNRGCSKCVACSRRERYIVFYLLC